MSEPKIEITETNELIAVRVPKGDRWKLVSVPDNNKIYPSLTEVLEAYFMVSQFKGEYRLAPLDSKLYAIIKTVEEVVPPPPKNFNIYGEEE